VDPLSDCLGVDLLFLLAEDGHDLLLGIGEVLVLLVGGIEVELAHLMGLQGNSQEIDDLDEFVHAEQVLGELTLVECHQEKVQEVLFLVLGRRVGFVLEDRH
jgi:hypothetical protein